MGKIKSQRHHKVKDRIQLNKRIDECKSYNQRPSNPDNQEVPRGLREMMERQQPPKPQTTQAKKAKQRKKRDDALHLQEMEKRMIFQMSNDIGNDIDEDEDMYMEKVYSCIEDGFKNSAPPDISEIKLNKKRTKDIRRRIQETR